jgi:anion-transporting  ArsA/GET3 family ATPase
MPDSSRRFDSLLTKREIVVCVGSGGVGKTTTSAVIGLQAALSGRRALVLTIDPARRLANSLGVDRLGNEPRQIPLDRFDGVDRKPGGELWAMMLDMKQSFDHLVNRYAPTAEAKHTILRNRLYQYFSTSLAGTQEYAAAERLYELYNEGDYDLIVLDTPPTSHALDFLEAPNRLVDAINNRALQWLKPGKNRGRLGRGLMSVGVNYVMKTLSKFTGGEMLSELGTFLQAFSTLFGGFQERAAKVRELLTSDVATFAVVSSPTAANIDEAIYFYDKLGAEAASVGAFVVNRVHPSWVPTTELKRPSIQMAQDLAGLHPAFEDLGEEDKKTFARKLRTNAAEFQVLADLDAEAIERLRDHVPNKTPLLRVPYFSRDIHSLAGLDYVRRALFVEEQTGAFDA